MAIYVVMEKAGKPGADGGREAILVRDGFSFLAFLLPAVWLLWHRLWIEGLLALALTLCLGAFGGALGFGAWTGTALSLLISLYVSLEGAALRVAVLRRRGWREWGIVKGDNHDDAETRYLFESSAEVLAAQAPLGATQPAWAPARSTGPALGLFDYPGRR